VSARLLSTRWRARAWLTLAGGLLAMPAGACEGLEITGAWIREPPPGTGAVAAYMRLHNAGTRPLAIEAISSPAFAMGMLHETVSDGDRVQMKHVASLRLPAGKTLELAPGGLHAMLMRPTGAPPRAGDTLPVELHCADHSLLIQVPVSRNPP